MPAWRACFVAASLAACAAEEPALDRRPANPTCRAPARAPLVGSEGLPARLAETGCFDPADPTRPLAALIPYTVNAPLWSDGAEKDRWLALPDEGRIHVGADGDWDLPPGAVLIKTFRLGARRIETRFYVRHQAGEWSGYTYAWNESGTDAVLLDEGSHRQPIPGGEWHFPSRAECDRCHTAGAGHSLGLETAQLDRIFTYPDGRAANQLVTFERIGLFDDPPGASAALADPAGGAPIESRARAYLHANCANCHRPGVGSAGSTDFRHATPLAAAMACDAEPLKGTLGHGRDVRIIAPGKPDASLLILRMRALDSTRMPSDASLVVDADGVALLSAWIGALSGCL